MLVPQRLTVRGFRGYRGQVEFDLQCPAVIFFGENHAGKSSTLNAIEWCLFGDDCLGKQTGIRERIGWVLANQHQPTPEAFVELELAHDADCYAIRRRWARHGKRSALHEVRLQLPGGEVLTGEAAEERLARLRQAEFRDFLTTVYQHQEAIRAVLTQEPKERNDAIDRLLGLACYRNLLDALGRARASERYKALNQRFERFEQQLQTVLATRGRDLEELRFAASQAGIPEPQQSAAGGLAAARAVSRHLDQFAQDAGLDATPVPVPPEWTGLASFEAAVRQRLAGLRGELPCVRQQQELFRQQTAIAEWSAQWEGLRANVGAVGCNARDLDKQYGGLQSVRRGLVQIDQALAAEEALLRSTNGRAALVREAIGYLSAPDEAERDDSCPVCRQRAPELLAALRAEWDKRLSREVGSSAAKIEELRARKQEWQAVERRYAGLDLLLQQAQQDQRSLRQRIADYLKTSLSHQDDVLALLQHESRTLHERGDVLKEAVAAKVQRLDEIERALDRVRRIREILGQEAKCQLLDRIQQTRAYEELEDWRDRAAQWLGDVEAMQSAVSMTARAEAVERLEAAEQMIDDYFHRLARHPAIHRIRLQVTEVRERNHYAITDEAGQDLTPVLSQGDLNALALAIFLGLASAGGTQSAFGFVMLDDPSQSLGSAHKEALVEVLDDVGRERRLILATMDAEFRELLRRGLTRSKQEYVFADWSVEHGPTLAAEAVR